MSVCVLVEGGGDQKRTQAACRKAFKTFFDKVLGDRPKPAIVACGARDEAWKDFLRALADGSDAVPVLLVDAEGPVARGKTPTAHLHDRDGWNDDVPEDQVHLMVQCMESWFVADKAALGEYYGQRFRENSLPRNPKVEEIPKRDVMDGLEAATSETTKGRYHKTNHGFDILERIDPDLVRDASNHAKRLLDYLESQLTGG